MTTLLKPGFLVSLKTSLTGGVSYSRIDLDAERPEGGAELARWETLRKIEDPDEHKRATKVRSAARALIESVCVKTAFGLLCQESKSAELDEKIQSAHALVDAHNQEAHWTHVRVYALRGRIASTDEEAVKALSSEVRELLDEMTAGIRRVDVAAIRDAASRAKKLGQILDADQAAKVNRAVEAARDAAKQIVKNLELDGAEAVRAVAESMSGPIEQARFAFLELEESIPSAPPAVAPAGRVDIEVH
jgi:DNA primase large subunit